MVVQIAPDDIVERHDEVTSERGPLLVLEPLSRFLDDNGIGFGGLRIAPLGEGHSNPTFTVSRDGVTVVLRRPPRPPYPTSAHNVLREARIMEAVRDAGGRVPRVLAACDDESVIGAPFYITEMVDGSVFTLRTPSDFDTPAGRRGVAEELVDALVEIHAVEWEAAGLGDLARQTGYAERQLQRFSGLLDEYRTREIAPLDRVSEWLQDNIPASLPSTIVHGDYRLGNVMFGRGTPVRLLAVFDWEMATIGDPLADLGYMSAMWAERYDPAGLHKLSAVTADGYPSRDDLVALYAERSGRPTASVTWYQVMALWKFCVIMEGNYRRAVSGISDDDFAKRFGKDVPAIAETAERLALANR